MTITYDILVDDGNGHPKECLYNGIESKHDANSALHVWRSTHPTAYLVKIVQTRCPEIHKPYWRKNQKKGTA